MSHKRPTMSIYMEWRKRLRNAAKSDSYSSKLAMEIFQFLDWQLTERLERETEIAMVRESLRERNENEQDQFALSHDDSPDFEEITEVTGPTIPFER